MDYMIFIIFILIMFVAILLKFKLATRKNIQSFNKTPQTCGDGEVQCFSCGMIIEEEKALEKKGRYFCGVKRNDRHGRSIIKR